MIGFQGMLHRHGNGDFGYGDRQSYSWSFEYESGSGHAYILHSELESTDHLICEWKERNKDGHCHEKEDHK